MKNCCVLQLDVSLCTTRRRPPFASTSLVPVEARPAEKGAGKPKNEGGKRKGKKAAAKEMDLETFRAMPREQKKELLAKVLPHAWFTSWKHSLFWLSPDFPCIHLSQFIL